VWVAIVCGDAGCQEEGDEKEREDDDTHALACMHIAASTTCPCLVHDHALAPPWAGAHVLYMYVWSGGGVSGVFWQRETTLGLDVVRKPASPLEGDSACRSKEAGKERGE